MSPESTHHMDTTWLLAGVGTGTTVLIFVLRRLLRRRDLDMGTMSDQWMAEQRLGHGPDPNR